MKTKIAIGLAVAGTLGWRAEAQTYDTNDDVVQIFAGSGTVGNLNAQGTLAMFNNPQFVVADTSGNSFVLDSRNGLIRKITPDGTVSTYTSIPFGGYTGGMAIDGNNTIWISASSSGIYEVTSSGSVTVLSGMGSPSGICADAGNNIYYTTGNQVYRISSSGVLSLFAGSTSGGSTDANGIYATFNAPAAVAADAARDIYVWDSGNGKIRRIDQSQNVTTIAGSGSGANADGVGTNASFSGISSMCIDSWGNVIMACGPCIRKMTAATNVVTMAGSFSQSSYANGAGALARFSGASGVCLSQGRVFVADTGNQRIRFISFSPQPQPVTGADLALATYAGVTVSGLVGRTYQIQASTDLTTWSTVTTLLLTGSPYLWFDTAGVGQKRFYRAYLLPWARRAAMDEPASNPVTCRCNNCDGYLQFEREHAGERADCPHCKIETVLYVPDPPVGIPVPPQEQPPPTPVAPPVIATRPPPLEVVWFGTEASTIEIRLASGTAIEVKEIQLYDGQELNDISAEKAQAVELLGGAQSQVGFIGSPLWAVGNMMVQNCFLQKQSEKMAVDGSSLIQRLAERERQLRNTRDYFPVGRIQNVDYPAPSLWRVVDASQPSVRYAFIHSGDDFVTLKDTTGIVHSIRWSAVEQYNYRVYGSRA